MGTWVSRPQATLAGKAKREEPSVTWVRGQGATTGLHCPPYCPASFSSLPVLSLMFPNGGLLVVLELRGEWAPN